MSSWLKDWPIRMALSFVCTFPSLQACKTSDGAQAKNLENTAELSDAGCKDTPAKVVAGSGPQLFPGPTCQELSKRFTRVYDKNEPEDKKVICPFLRLLKRTGLLDEEIQTNLAKSPHSKDIAPVTLAKLMNVTGEIGCDGAACVAVAQSVAKTQRIGEPATSVDIARLFDAPPRSTFKDQSKDHASHDCGYTFQFADETVNDKVRDATMARFKEIADQNGGKIYIADLVKMKKESCKRDYLAYKASGKLPFNRVDEANKTLVPDSRDHTEVALIFAYLGGIDRGYVTHEDLDRFFHAQFPPNKTRMLLNFPLLGMAQAAFEGMW